LLRPRKLRRFARYFYFSKLSRCHLQIDGIKKTPFFYLRLNGFLLLGRFFLLKIKLRLTYYMLSAVGKVVFIGD
jgi:hypothetical protein